MTGWSHGSTTTARYYANFIIRLGVAAAGRPGSANIGGGGDKVTALPEPSLCVEDIPGKGTPVERKSRIFPARATTMTTLLVWPTSFVQMGYKIVYHEGRGINMKTPGNFHAALCDWLIEDSVSFFPLFAKNTRF